MRQKKQLCKETEVAVSKSIRFDDLDEHPHQSVLHLLMQA